MNEEEIKSLIESEVNKKVLIAKQQLSNIIDKRFLYTGEYAGARKLIDAVREWVNKDQPI